MMTSKESTPLITEDLLDSERSNNSSLRHFIESFSSSERQHALQVLGVGPAASLIKDAVLGFQDAPYEVK